MSEHCINSLKIEKLVYKGFGLGYHNSNPVFVLNSVPGDIVDVIVYKSTRKALFAKIQKIVHPSKDRIETGCEVFSNCGGCDWLCLSYDNQLKYKDIIIKDFFKNYSSRILKPTQASSEIFHYRNKSYLPLSGNHENVIIGMYAKNSHSIITHQNCQIQPAIFDQISKCFIEYVKASKAKIYNEETGLGNIRFLGIRFTDDSDHILVIIVTKNRKLSFTKQLVRILVERFPEIKGVIQDINPKRGNRILGNDYKVLYGVNYLEETIGSVLLRLNYNSFYQINNHTTLIMYSFIKENIELGAHVIDAYCGIGSIGLFVADKAVSVVGIEKDPHAISNALFNRDLNKFSNCEFISGDVEDELMMILKPGIDYTIIFDPPRKGLDLEMIKKLHPERISKIIYVSCNPSTQIRDIRNLEEKGFKVESIQPFDMFPHTYHIENVVIMVK